MSSSIPLHAYARHINPSTMPDLFPVMRSRMQAAVKRHWGALLLLCACSLIATAPLLMHGPSCGHDFDFHLLSWLEASHDWQQGLLDPQWLATANYGAGEPRFIFYPPASWMAGALLGSAGGALLGAQAGWNAAPVIFTFLCFFAAGVSAWLLVRTMASPRASIVAACLFITNPYMLFVAYERAAYGELLAAPLMALLLYCSLRRRLQVAWTAMVIAALWFTNAPAAVMGCYTLAFVCVTRLARERAWGNALRSAAATVLGVALAGCYLVPAIRQQRWVQIGRAVSEGMRIEDSFLFEHTGQTYHDQVLHSASVLVVILFGVAAVSLAVLLLRRRRNEGQVVLVIAALMAMILLLQFPISRTLWHAAPRLLFLQFPWRWLLVASVATACLVGMALNRLKMGSRSAAWAVYLGMLVIVNGSTWACSRSFVQYCDEQDRVSGQLEAFQNGAGVEGTDEYTSTSADNSAIFQDLPEVRLLARADAGEAEDGAADNPEWEPRANDADGIELGEVGVSKWAPEQKQINVATKRPAFAVLRLMDYPSWTVMLNGRVVYGRLKRDDGLMVIAVPAGSSQIAVSWKTTPDVVLGREISAAALVVLLTLFMRQRRLRGLETAYEVSDGTS